MLLSGLFDDFICFDKYFIFDFQVIGALICGAVPGCLLPVGASGADG